ncbi:His-Xaa-Ser system radical SAM maturase HxsB [Thermodesulfobacteriota bacterium]
MQTSNYKLMPFQFIRMPDASILLVNEGGEFYFLEEDYFYKLIDDSLDSQSDTFLDLKSKQFLTDSQLTPVIDMLATKLRTRKAYLKNFTSLHMVVVTLHCNHRCSYCHASSEEEKGTSWHMSPDTGRKVVDTIFRTPSRTIKIEFQGGEPLLNWKTITEIVQYAEMKNQAECKNLEFVLCTNLTLIDEEKLDFIKEHNILVSSSFDGPKEIHDSNRILRLGGSSYDQYIEKLNLTRNIIGKDKVSALMTTTRLSLENINRIIDEYIRLDFDGIFLRALNPFGFAKEDESIIGYSTEKFVEVYKKALDYIIQININGRIFPEFFTTLLLSRILTPFTTGFVDLQSPAGTGIAGVIYNYNGDVYPSDEARMLAKMGDKKFRMGNVYSSDYLDMFSQKGILGEMLANSLVESIPGCAWCAFQQYCGADPVRNYSDQGDLTGFRPTNDFCKKHKAIFKHLFSLIKQNDEEVMSVFWSWITKRPFKDIVYVDSSRQSSSN